MPDHETIYSDNKFGLYADDIKRLLARAAAERQRYGYVLFTTRIDLCNTVALLDEVTLQIIRNITREPNDVFPQELALYMKMIDNAEKPQD